MEVNHRRLWVHMPSHGLGLFQARPPLMIKLIAICLRCGPKACYRSSLPPENPFYYPPERTTFNGVNAHTLTVQFEGLLAEAN